MIPTICADDAVLACPKAANNRRPSDASAMFAVADHLTETGIVLD